MMMPANYSVIAENEMTYVNGGALIDCFAPLMTSSNWKTFNTNLIKIIGNSFMQPVIDATLGVLFGGSFSDGEPCSATLAPFPATTPASRLS